MSEMSTRWGWFLGIAIGSAYAFSGNCVHAQITTDGTLPNNSIVTPDGSTLNITGGTQAGSNLFHSFKEFSVPTGGTAFFNNAVDIQNIISRVTGGSVSNIDGLIRANGTANLFLINPNGIIFGRNASLNIGGSFVASTANAIQFGNQGFFSASNPESSSSLLTVNPSALLFNQIRPTSIQNNSVANSGLNPSSEFTARGLRVPDGKSLLLVGGDISMNGGGLYAFGGRVELGGLAGTGTVGLNRDGNNLSLSFPNSIERSDVSLSNSARVNVIAGDGGSIAVSARNLEMTGSFLLAGIESGLGSDNSKARNIEVNATGVINLNNSSFINNGVRADANGQGGDVNISASTLQVEGGAQVSASTLGAGKGGNLSVDAQKVQLIGTSADGQVSALATAAQPNSTGNAGDLTLKTSTLQVKDGAQVSTSTIGAGKGGNLTVDAKDIQLIGKSANGRFRSMLSASAQRNSTGDAGDLTIRTNTLQLKDGAQVTAGTFGAGKGGNLSVDAQNVQLIGESSGLFAPSAQRNSTGDAGDLTIKTNTLLVQDGAQVFTGTFGAGKGGNLTVDAKDVQLIGTRADGQIVSALGTAAQSNSTGDAGDLTIKTNTLLVQDGAQVFTSTFGAGKGGNLTVDAQNVQLIGFYAETPSVYVPSGLFANTDIGAIGNGGNITIEAHKLLVQNAALIFAGTRTDLTSPSNGGSVTINVQQLRLQNGGQIGTGTRSAGRGGNLQVNADTVQLVGFRLVGTDKYPSSLFSDSIAEVTGDAGDLTIKTNTLLVQDEAQISVESSGTGTAGSMTLNARSIRLDNNALLSANTQSAKFDPNREQATININSRDLIMRRGSNITTNATGENVIGGNINIDTDVLAAFENSDISANSANFRGGNVRINAQGIFGTQFRNVASDKTSDITATGASPESSGTVEINQPDVDLSRGLINLPSVPVDTEVAQSCTAGGTVAKSEFTITGRGGLPPNPGEALNTDAVQVDLITLNPSSDNRKSPTVTSKTTTAVPERIVEATGWIINEKGEVVLIANAPTTTPHSPSFNQPDCRAS